MAVHVLQRPITVFSGSGPALSLVSQVGLHRVTEADVYATAWSSVCPLQSGAACHQHQPLSLPPSPHSCLPQYGEEDYASKAAIPLLFHSLGHYDLLVRAQQQQPRAKM